MRYLRLLDMRSVINLLLYSKKSAIVIQNINLSVSIFIFDFFEHVTWTIHGDCDNFLENFSGKTRETVFTIVLT